VSAELRLRLQRGQRILLVLALGHPSEVVPKMITLRENLERSRGWPAELAPTSAKGPSPITQRSVLTIRQLVDRSGAILAGPPIDQGFSQSGGYAFCWPRDGAFIAQGLDTVGDHKTARNFFSWALSVQPEDGIWKQRYYADGTEAPCWATHQLDETGTLLWALDQHLQAAFDEELMERGLKAAVRAYRAIARLAKESGWPPKTQNLWEDQEGTHLYTLAALLAGARAWNTRIRASKEEGADVFARAESHLEEALASWPVQEKTGVMARAIVATPRGLKPDFTMDASLLGLSVPFGILDRTDARLTSTIEALERDLVNSSGRVLRYAGDTYRGGNAWPLLGLWLAWHKLRAGDKQAAVRLYRRVLDDQTPSGLIAEQVDARTGAAVWVVPLPWAHAWFLVLSHELKKHIT
jgi:GH15 family glucan-1,4-alpha-glucosidase